MNIDYFFVCDGAFPLELYLIKPNSKRHLSEERRIFNYRLLSAKRVSENTFSTLCAGFGVLHTKNHVPTVPSVALIIKMRMVMLLLVNEEKMAAAIPVISDQCQNVKRGVQRMLKMQFNPP